MEIILVRGWDFIHTFKSLVVFIQPNLHFKFSLSLSLFHTLLHSLPLFLFLFLFPILVFFLHISPGEKSEDERFPGKSGCHC